MNEYKLRISMVWHKSETQPPLQLWNKEEEDDHHKTRSTIKALTRKKWMNKSIGPTKCQRSKSKRWHDKRMRKKGCNLGDKKLMNSSRCEASRTRKTSSKREGPSRVIYPSSYGVITLQ
jgi:hypothetical protein